MYISYFSIFYTISFLNARFYWFFFLFSFFPFCIFGFRGCNSNIKEIPYHLSDYDFTDGLPGSCMIFFNGFLTHQFIDSIGNSEFSEYTYYRNIIDFDLWVDGFESYNANNQLDPQGLLDIVWGRFSGTFINERQDTLKITDGRFRLKKGIYREGN